jgi:signal transduction histidine kinase
MKHRFRTVLTALFSARTWRCYGYLLSGVVIAAPTFVLAIVGIVAAAWSILTIGLPVLAGVLALARISPAYFRAPARFFLGWEWDLPQRQRARGWRRLPAILGDPVGWRALVYCFAGWVLRFVSAYIATVFLVVGTLAVTYPLWWHWQPTAVFDAVGWDGSWRFFWQGLLALLAMPWVVRLAVGADRLLVRGLLEPSREGVRIAELESSRAALRDDAAATLRRVERDLHDGTQARLVSLGVTLSRIERRATEPDVKALAGDARGTVTEALAELRDIVRGLHPPALDDGLEVALTTLAARSAVPAAVTVVIDGRPSDATASALYFTVAELLTNVARHAGATHAQVDVWTDGDWLRLAVTDDGHGGARLDSLGTGLAGLARRAQALDGTLTVQSPAGGPTTVTLQLPREE